MATEAQIEAIVEKVVAKYLADTTPAPSRYTGKDREGNPNWFASSMRTNTNDHAFAADKAANEAVSILKRVEGLLVAARKV